MELRDLSACSMQEIAGIGHDKNALETLTKFCQMNFGTKRPKFGGSFASAGTLYSFYIFSEAVSLTGEKPVAGRNRFYAQEFASLLTELHLGEVWSSPVRVNVAFHKDHSNRVFVWMVDRDALLTWWKSLPQPEPVRPALTGTWKIGIIEKARGFVCNGPTVGNDYYGCGTAFADGDLAWWKFDGASPSSYVLCRNCAVITEEEAKVATTFPPVRHGWYTETVVPDRAKAWVCNGGYERGGSGMQLYTGCNTPIKGGPIHVYFAQGNIMGYILCAACTKKYKLAPETIEAVVVKEEKPLDIGTALLYTEESAKEKHPF